MQDTCIKPADWKMKMERKKMEGQQEWNEVRKND